MKKFLRSTAVLTLLFGVTAAMANEPRISLKTGDGARSLILIMDAASGKSDIQITDSNNNTVYYENVWNGSYAKKFDLGKLKNGTYYFTVEIPSKKVVYAMDLNNKEIKIGNKSVSTQIPVLRKSGAKIYLNLLNKDQNKVSVRVFNGRHELLKSKTFKDDVKVGAVFNFENANKDYYTVIVKDHNNVYRQGISIE